MTDEHKDYEKLLSDPFEESDIEWRVQQSGMSKNPWVMVIPYVTNRAITQRLDDVFGLFGWEDEYKPTPDGRGMLCGITVCVGEKKVTKWDGAEIPRQFTQAEIDKGKKQTIDPIKTVLSNSEKRAAVKFGIGRYLYNLETQFATCQLIENRSDCKGEFIKIKRKNTNERINAEWFPPDLEAWALPSVQSDQLIKDLENSESLIDLRKNFEIAYKYTTSFKRSDITKKIIKIKDEKKLYLEKEEKQAMEKSEDQKQAERKVWINQELIAYGLIDELRPLETVYLIHMKEAIKREDNKAQAMFLNAYNKRKTEIEK